LLRSLPAWLVRGYHAVLREKQTQLTAIQSLILVFMKALSLLIVPLSIFALLLSGCKSPEPSPEEQTREQQRQREAARARANFFKESPPPASNPDGQDQ